MKPKFITITFGLIFIALAAQQAQSLGPADTLRNEYGVIINVPPPGQEGVDYVKQQFIASLKPSFLTLPQGQTGANLIQCQVEAALLNLLQAHNVNYVRQVFTGYQLGDTIRIIGQDTCKVPDLSQIYLFQQSIQSGVINAVNALYGHEAILYAEPNFVQTITRTPNDTYWNNQWNLKNTGNGIGCQTAWDASAGSQTVRIGILDTGIDYNHTDLGGPGYPNNKVGGGYDYAYDDNNPMDVHTHGTRCSGIAGALTNNASGVAGIGGGWNAGPSDKGVKLFAIKVLDDNGDGEISDIARGVREAADPEIFACNILSNSYGSYNYADVERNAINFAYQVGASFVAAKGNDGSSNPHYPSDYDYSWITAVASYGQNGIYCQDDINCSYSSNYGVGIDITAPGTAIYTTTINNGIYQYFNGTSSACPHVAGSIGLVRSKRSGLRNEDTDWIIKYSANDNFGGGGDNNVWTWNERYGHGDLRISTAMIRLGHPLMYSRYELTAHTATGGFEDSHTGFIRYNFFGSPLNGAYLVRRYDVRVNVTYEKEYEGMPFVWGIGFNTTGWSGSNPNYQSGWCSLVTGSQTAIGCQLQTFVYDVYDLLGRHIGWYPCHVNEVSLRYKLWGIPAAGNPDSPGGYRVPVLPTPITFEITSVYPNPFNASALIKFGLPDETPVTVEIYDLLGRKVVTLYDGKLSQGSHSILWQGTDHVGSAVPSGVYFCKLQSEKNLSTKKITLLR